MGIGLYVCLSVAPVAQRAEPWTRHTIDASSLGADGVRAADANGDGAMDLVTSWEQGGVTRVYLADRSKPGEPAWKSITVGKSPDGEDAVFFDADGDGDLDIISSAEGSSRNIQIHWAPQAGAYARESEWRTDTLYADGSQWMFAVPMDVDRRRGHDLIVGGKNEGASIGWLESPADPRRAGDWKFHRLSDAGWIMSLIVKDMNGDTRPDVLLSDRVGAMAGVRWLENPSSASAALKAAAVGDIDLDGRRDIVLSCEQASNGRRGIVWLRSRGSPFQADWDVFDVSGAEGIKFDLNLLLDVDADGDLDVINSEENDNARDGKAGLGVVWYENPVR